MLRLKKYIWPYKGHVIGAALLALPLAALRVSPVPLIKYLVDDLLVTKDSRKLYLFPALIIGIFLVNFVIRFFHYYLLRYATVRIGQNLKNDLFTHMMGLSSDYFGSNSVGSLISRVSHDPNYLDVGLQSINVFLREPVTFIFLVGYAFTLNWKLTLLTLTIFPLLAWVFRASAKHFKRYVSGMTQEHGKIVSSLQESFSGFRIIQLFSLNRYVEEKFKKTTSDFATYALKSAKLEEISHPMIELVTSFAIALLIYRGGSAVIGGEMTSGDLMAFFAAFALMIDPIRKLNDVNIKFNQASSAVDRVFEVFSWKTRLQEKPGAPELDSFRDSIEFKDVVFSYPDAPERDVLNGVSFKVQKGRVVALVGPSGSGKSSLVNLLPRVFDPNSGQILIDGKDIRDYGLLSLRNQVSVVSQDVFLFNDTILENIRCGKRDATDVEIMEAAKRANALDFIGSLPGKMNTVVGDRGMKLSGGERQRISIARAFLRHSPILILDEATSNLDNASERLVQQSIYDLMKDRTTLMIAHRLSTVQRCDEILVLKEGRVLERGTHDRLLEGKGEYFFLHQLSQRS